MKYLIMLSSIILILFGNTTYAQTYIAGNVSGTWTKAGSPYILIADATVPSGQSLTIQPGVVIKIGLGLKFTIGGTLNAFGTVTDSITFTTTENPPATGQWGQIIISGTASFQYCIIQYGGANNQFALANTNISSILNIQRCSISANYAGVYLIGTSSRICNSFVRANTNDGVKLRNGAVVDSCTIENNRGNGITLDLGNATVRQSVIRNNTSFSNPSGYVSGGVLIDGGVNAVSLDILNTIVSSNGNAGIYAWKNYGSVSVTIHLCELISNGAGVYAYGGPNINIDSSIITSNVGDGIYARYGKVKLSRNIIYSNGGDGVSQVGANSIIENNTITKNTNGISQIVSNAGVLIRNNIIAYNSGTGIGSSVTPPPVVKFNDVYGNTSNFSGFSSFYGDTTLGFKNKNGVGCDPFSNINLNPLFVNTVGNDYHLQAASPCIYAGDTLSNLDPDSTVADIGVFYHSRVTSVDNVQAVIPRDLVLWQNYPNPFNPSTRIKFALPERAKVNLSIYNLLGEKVVELVNGEMNAGYHETRWNASGFASGVYFYTLQAGKFVETKKLILVK